MVEGFVERRHGERVCRQLEKKGKDERTMLEWCHSAFYRIGCKNETRSQNYLQRKPQPVNAQTLNLAMSPLPRFSRHEA